MSVRVMSDVWAASAARGNDLLVLLAIADHANDEDRSAWPSITHLAAKCRLSRSTVERSLRRLTKLGELQTTLGVGTTNRYRVFDPRQYDPPVNLTPPSGSDGGTPVNLTGGVRHSYDVRNHQEPSRREPSPKGWHRVSTDESLTPARMSIGLRYGFPEEKIRRHWADFVSFRFKNERYDVDRTWVNWIEKEASSWRPPAGGGGSTARVAPTRPEGHTMVVPDAATTRRMMAERERSVVRDDSPPRSLGDILKTVVPKGVG